MFAGGFSRIAWIIAAFDTYTTTFTDVAVTPCAVAPPLSLPSGHGLTQKAPAPSYTPSVRPFLLHVDCASASFENRPTPLGDGPVPVMSTSEGGAAPASEALVIPSTTSPTTTTARRAALEAILIAPPQTSMQSPR